jgi:DNA anti-recombination protein RmuC
MHYKILGSSFYNPMTLVHINNYHKQQEKKMSRLFKPVVVTPAPKKRTIWANCVEFVQSVRDLFKAKEANEDFEENYRRYIAISALKALKEQKIERKMLESRFNDLTSVMSENMSQMNQQINNLETDSNQFREQFAKHQKELESELRKQADYVEEMRKKDLEQRLSRVNGGSGRNLNVLEVPMVKKPHTQGKDVFEQDMSSLKKNSEE